MRGEAESKQIREGTRRQITRSAVDNIMYHRREQIWLRACGGQGGGQHNRQLERGGCGGRLAADVALSGADAGSDAAILFVSFTSVADVCGCSRSSGAGGFFFILLPPLRSNGSATGSGRLLICCLC